MLPFYSKNPLETHFVLWLSLCALYLLSVCENLVQTGLSGQLISLHISWNDRSVLSLMLELTMAHPHLTGNRICQCALCLLQVLLPVALSVMIARALSLGRWALICIHPRILQWELIWHGAREGFVHKVVPQQICEGLVPAMSTLLQCQI